MSVISLHAPHDAAGSEQEPRDFWQRLALTVDRYFADRTKRTVPQATLRRSRQDFERCRRLLHKT